MALTLWRGFSEAAARAVREAHAKGLAVPGRVDGVAVEVRPDGVTAPIDPAAWTPTAWKKSGRR